MTKIDENYLNLKSLEKKNSMLEKKLKMVENQFSKIEFSLLVTDNDFLFRNTWENKK